VARIAQGFGMKVLTFDPRPRPQATIALGIDFVGWSELLERSDVLSLHVPLSSDTHHLLDDDAFARIKPGVVLINTARGGLIDEEALLRALDRGTVSAAGLDVLEREDGAAPEAPMAAVVWLRPRLGIVAPAAAPPRALATPHVGFNARGGRGILHETVDNISAWQAGQPRHRVT
jgi:D-lactate dehydrogenase